MIILGYLIALAIGYLILVPIKELRSSFLLLITLGLGFGLGVCSLLSFFSFLLLNKFHPWIILTLVLVTFIVLIFFNRRFNQSLFPTFNKPSKFDIFTFIYWLIITAAIFFVANQHPYGEWDAWGMWNLKTKFIIWSDSWKNIFTQLSWHTHPDYPLLLPFMHVWICVFHQVQLHPVTYYTAIIFTLISSLLLYSGLRLFISKHIAFLASGILLSAPFYIFNATAQYADIVVGFYLLAGFIIILLALRENSSSLFLLAGLVFGLMTFSKNEGLAITIIFYLCLIPYILSNKESKWPFIKSLFKGTAITTSATIIFKIFLSPANEDILPNFMLSNLQQIPWSKNWNIFQSILIKETFEEKWCYIWQFIILLTVFKLPKFFSKECKVFTLFYIIYFTMVSLIYLSSTKVDLKWWMTSSLPRIHFTLLPSILFFTFYCFWKDKKQT